jgi:hypothetical protein
MLATEYRQQVKQLLVEFLYYDTELDAFLAGLRAVEKQLRVTDSSESKGLWLRLYATDTGVTTIDDIKRELAYLSHPNYDYMMEGFQICLERDELEVYYS